MAIGNQKLIPAPAINYILPVCFISVLICNKHNYKYGRNKYKQGRSKRSRVSVFFLTPRRLFARGIVLLDIVTRQPWYEWTNSYLSYSFRCVQGLVGGTEELASCCTSTWCKIGQIDCCCRPFVDAMRHSRSFKSSTFSFRCQVQVHAPLGVPAPFI